MLRHSKHHSITAFCLYFSLISPLHSTPDISQRPNLTDEHPVEVQTAIDHAFATIKNKQKDDWTFYKGSSHYGLLDLGDGRLIRHIAHTNTHKSDIYFMDVGCGDGSWGNNAVKVLEEEATKNPHIQYHVLSITGGKECVESKESYNNIHLYQLTQFKIENIDEELLKRGFDLKNKVDLIVSHWTLRHLVNPFGTLKRMYSLLTPTYGKLLSNGFLFALEDTPDIKAFPVGEHYNALSSQNTVALFNNHDSGRDAHHFLLMKNNNTNELNIPFTYSGKVRQLGYGYQCYAGVTTEFKNDARKNTTSRYPSAIISDKEKHGPFDHYAPKDDIKAQELYAYLIKHKLFWPRDKDGWPTWDDLDTPSES